MARDLTDDRVVESRDQLVAWLESGSKAPEDFRVGTEHEKFPFAIETGESVPYAAEGGGVHGLLEGLRRQGGWEGIEDAGALIGLYNEVSGAAVSLEPGGQFELSGAPLRSVHDTAIELRDHLEAANAVAERIGVRFLGLGMTPTWTRASIPIMPKSRYRIMMSYMPRVGSLGVDMMLRTCTVQANLDFASEADMVRKLRVSLALQPAVTALFANSPFTEGRPNGFLSMRSEIWRDTDRDRTGMLPFAFEDGMGFERYVDYALDVPMYFVKRGDRYHDVAGASFRDLLSGRLESMPGERATIADWANHLSTIFPEVRLKRFLEMRGADMGDAAHVVALPALFVGLLYDPASLDAASALVRPFSFADLQAARDAAPREGLAARMGSRTLLDIARDALTIARDGLTARGSLDDQGRDERIHLECLEQRVARGRAPAQDWLEAYHGRWNRSVRPIFREAAL
jgi:glutamate--cysteine ligase